MGTAAQIAEDRKIGVAISVSGSTRRSPTRPPAVSVVLYCSRGIVVSARPPARGDTIDGVFYVSVKVGRQSSLALPARAACFVPQCSVTYLVLTRAG